MQATKTVLNELLTVISRENFVVLDTETTGLNEGEVCQIAIIDNLGHTLLDTLVRPMNPIPIDAIRIHGITNERVIDAPGWRLVAPTVQTLITGKDVITYNATYDRRMMHQAAEAANMEKIDWKTLSHWSCAMLAFAEFYGDWNDYHQNYRWQRLSVAAAHCGIEVIDAHRALGDCIMTLGVVRYMQAHPLNDEF